MTSSAVADALLRELSFLSDVAPPARGPNAFGFALDFEPTLVWPDSPFDTSTPCARYSLPAREEVRDTVDAAARLLAARAMKALDFINLHMNTALAVRSDAIEGASSASNRSLVGFCVLTNMHAAADRVLVCTEALVHESIHQYLYKTELADGNFCDLGDGRTYRSPWTGSRIPLHSLVHACFVWYGLLTLWCQLARRGADQDDASLVRDKASRAMFGFAFVRQVFASPAFPLTSVEPPIVAAINRVAESMPTLERLGVEQRSLRESLRQWENGDWVAPLERSLRHAGPGEAA
jgi:HEXXH motif-containing protein